MKHFFDIFRLAADNEELKVINSRGIEVIELLLKHTNIFKRMIRIFMILLVLIIRS